MSLKSIFITTALAAAVCGPAFAAPVPLTIAYQTGSYSFPVGSGNVSLNNVVQTASGGVLAGSGFLANAVGTPPLAFSYTGVNISNIIPITAPFPTPGGTVLVPIGAIGSLSGGTFIIGDPLAPFLVLSLNSASAALNYATSIGTTINGAGILNVDSGTARHYFNTNSFDNGGDLQYSVTFTNCTFANPTCNGGGSISFKTQQVSIPEPGSLALGAVGLLAVGAWRRRRVEGNS